MRCFVIDFIIQFDHLLKCTIEKCDPMKPVVITLHNVIAVDYYVIDVLDYWHGIYYDW